jgi:arylsulfatase A-like enzyme
LRVAAGPAARLALAAAALAAIAGAATLAPHSSPAAAAAAKRPNFLIILVDDQADNTFNSKFMPQTYRWIVNPGTKFTAGLAAPPLCCPDRAGILTGQYPHNNGVFSNDPGYASLRDKGDTLPAWLQHAGYRTGFVGKFLNGTPQVLGNRGAPGFDSWFGFNAAPGYYHYTVSDNGRPRSYGFDPHAYSTDVFTRRAKRFVRDSHRHRRPFFLWLSYNAPHDTRLTTRFCGHSSPVPRRGGDFRRYAHVHLPRKPSFNEAHIHDKPPWIADLPKLSPRDIHHVARRYRCTAATMHTVDGEIGKLMRQLKQTGELRRTIVFYLSDNGYFFGEHRITRGKSYPYEPSLQVPYAVRIPAAFHRHRERRRIGQVVSNEDVAPTILDYAGARPCASRSRCRVPDGLSLQPLLGGRGRWPRDRGILAEINSALTDYAAIRTRRYIYVRYRTGQRELYDLKRDPWELRNVAGHRAYARTQTTLGHRLAALRRCHGTRGRRSCS